MSKPRLAVAVASVALALYAGSAPSAQAPTLDEVLKRAATYVADFRKQFAGIVAEETYTQEIVNTGRFTDALEPKRRRLLKSDLLLVKPQGASGFIELRDVYEVDNSPIRNRQARLEQLLHDSSTSGTSQIAAIIRESARYNIGTVTRNINTPLMTLQFLDADTQSRFTFKHVNEKASPVFTDKQDAALNEMPVFRVSTEMWNVEYRERARNTIIRNVNGADQPTRGRFWINPSNGSVMISELIVDGGGVRATITVSYQSEPLMGFLVPVQMRETYQRAGGERIVGEAEYGKFRPIQ